MSNKYQQNKQAEMDEAHSKLMAIEDYLITKKIYVSQAELVIAAINIAKRLGAGDWTFACEFEGKKGK